VSHAWLFPRVAAAIHHGGIGTFAAALGAGCVSIPIPFAYDQFFWGRRAAARGLGPEPLPARSLTVRGLRERVDAALGEWPALRRARARLAEEDGVARAVARIEGL
jgi:sterol 3beta-glucosyltransferase